MGKVFKKAAVAILAVSMFLQQCNIVSFAEGDPTEMSAEAAAAAEAEAAAQAEAEAAAAQAAAEAEAQAQAEAEAAAAAQAQAEAEAAVQAQAEAEAAAAAQAQAEAEAAAQAEAEAAAAAQAQAEAEAAAQAEAEAAAAAQAEAEAQAAAEAEAAAAAEAEALAAAEAETETEMQARSARVNTGTEIRKEDLTTMLTDILPYLFVADTIVFPETQAEAEEAAEPQEEAAEFQEDGTDFLEEETIPVPKSWVLNGDAATAALAGQTWNSLELANAQSTDEVTVINLYADETGALDTAQLYTIYEDQILDITNERDYVINVIADSPEQVLDFSGFDLSENGIYYYYTESTQPGSVLYNFAAMDGEENYTDYRGTLRLWGNMQGTVLAPAAYAEVEENLAGAVYAQNISVISPEAQLQRNILIEGEPEPIETEAPETETPVPETEAPAPETEAPAPETEAPAPETEAPAPETETLAPETEAPAPETEAPAPETEAPANEIAGLSVIETPETEALETEAPAPETEAPAPETEAPETEAVSEVKTESETETEAEASVISTLAAGDLELLGEKEGEYTLEITAEVFYKEAEEAYKLTAYEEDKSYYIGLFADEDGTELIGEPKELTIEKDKTESDKVTFDEAISAGEYYIYEVKKDGSVVDNGDFTIEEMPIVIDNELGDRVDDEDKEKTIEESINLVYNDYPEGEFSYDVEVSVKLDVIGHDDEALKSDETFYAMIYKDSKLTEEAIEEPVEFAMDGKESHLKEKIKLKPTKEEQTFYIAETNESIYTATYESTGKSEYGELEVEFGKEPESPIETIINKLNDTIVNISIVNTSGKLLNGASYIILDSSLQPVTGTRTIEDDEIEVYRNKLVDGEKYCVYQVDAPDGYTPSPYKEFKVERGVTTDVVVEDEKSESTNSSITVSKSVYVDNYAVYATSEHTFYLALFKDEKHKEKVSNVKTVTVKGYTGTMTFEDVVPGETYYVAETDKYGIAVSRSDPAASYSPDSGKVKVTENTNHQVQVQNKYSYLPDGYVYTGQLTLTKKVVDASNSAKDVSGTFYIGLYKNSNYSDTPTVISISLNGQSSASVTNTFRLPEGSQTYYVAEVSDSKGSARITDTSEFDYTPTVSQTSVTITKDSINSNVQNVTVTNTEKVNADDEEGSGETMSVELYLTKRVYEGSNPHEVSDTFYIGLFKDKAMTTLYTNPISMPMAGREGGDLTQKITMSVSAEKETTIYVAEVHANGTPVRESEYQSFGYEIGSEQPIEVEFSPTQKEMRAVILNGVYGTMSAEDWENIYNDIEDLYGDDEIGLADDLEEDEAELESELAAEGSSSSVKTADDTPVAGTIALMAAALLVFGFSFRRRRRV